MFPSCINSSCGCLFGYWLTIDIDIFRYEIRIDDVSWDTFRYCIIKISFRCVIMDVIDWFWYFEFFDWNCLIVFRTLRRAENEIIFEIWVEIRWFTLMFDCSFERQMNRDCRWHCIVDLWLNITDHRWNIWLHSVIYHRESI